MVQTIDFDSPEIARFAVKTEMPAFNPDALFGPAVSSEPTSSYNFPFIKGLIDELPEPKSTWATEDRRNWLELALSIFNVVYKGADSSRRLVITIEDNSAK